MCIVYAPHFFLYYLLELDIRITSYNILGMWSFATNIALEYVNFTLINGKYIHVMFSNRDTTLWRNGSKCVQQKPWGKHWQQLLEQHVFWLYTILSCKVAIFLKKLSIKGIWFFSIHKQEVCYGCHQWYGMLTNGYLLVSSFDVKIGSSLQMWAHLQMCT
jgi:hypothetical protein